MDLDQLRTALDGARRHVLSQVEGLDVEHWRRPVLPSGWAIAGLVHHLAVDVETFWFAAVQDGRPEAIDLGADAWHPDASLTGPEIVAGYRAAVAESDAVLERTAATAAPQWWPSFFGEFRLDSLEEVVLHVLTETSTHAGHLDAVREILDGRQHLVLG